MPLRTRALDAILAMWFDISRPMQESWMSAVKAARHNLGIQRGA
jgi:hypothetical protein